MASGRLRGEPLQLAHHPYRLADRKDRVLASKFDGKLLNAPNDVTIDGKGRLYFTDPIFTKVPKNTSASLACIELTLMAR